MYTCVISTVEISMFIHCIDFSFITFDYIVITPAYDEIYYNNKSGHDNIA